ncbi:MAG: transcription initiation factor IIB [Candidatus Thermoplasmatota archaeon]|nr:transcription initiation factor IIB [Candidatus Thermoplasmatota archaeon]
MKNQIEIDQQFICPQCKSKYLTKDNQRGELICQDCGLVLDENLIDYSPEWRAFDNEQEKQRARTGSPMNELIFDKGLSTTIGWQNRDHYGNRIPARKQAQLRRLRKWHRRTTMRKGNAHNLHRALQYITQISSSMSLPRAVRENAAAIYRKASRNDLIRGRSINGFAAATVYAGCRRCNLPRSLDEVSDASDIDKKEIGRNYRFMSKELSLKLLPVRPQEYLNRFANSLNLKGDAIQEARDLITKTLENKTISGCSPASIAAAAIYVASLLHHDKKTQKEIAETAGVTEVTIRNHYKKIVNTLNLDVAI